MSEFHPSEGDNVWIEIDGGCFPGEVLSVSKLSGFVTAKIHTDPLHDFGRHSAMVMAEQVVAVRSTAVQLREDPSDAKR